MRMVWVGLVAVVVFGGLARAQSFPVWPLYYVPAPVEWQFWWSNKLDLVQTPTTVATLPACVPATEGRRATVTDALAPVFLGALVGGGTVHSPAYCTPTGWVAA